MSATRSTPPAILYLLVFFSGFANLATEIIGPRMFASLLGTTTVVWAVMISVTLVGLSVGYALGGRVKLDQVPVVLPVLMMGNAAWLVVTSWVVWEIPASAVSSGIRPDATVIMFTATAGFFVPSTLFGMTSPIAITLLSAGRPAEAISEIVGNIYAISTVGSVAGALGAAFVLIPWVGLSTSLQFFAVGLVLFAAYFWQGRARLRSLAAIILILLMPQPDWRWDDADDLTLLEQQEGYHQTIRVYENEDEGYVQMHLGPTFHSRVDLETKEPLFSYAQAMVEVSDAAFADLTDRRVLVVGGAGHGIAHAMENRGADVVEVEIDPFVVELSDRYFGEIEGEVLVQDGRIYMELAADEQFDVILIDAFDGAANVPPHLVTREFFEAVRRVLQPDGLMVYNFIGTPEGERSDSFDAISTTLNTVFDHTGSTAYAGDDSQNIVLLASKVPLTLDDLATLPDGGTLLTDNRNPMEIYIQRARDFTYFQR